MKHYFKIIIFLIVLLLGIFLGYIIFNSDSGNKTVDSSVIYNRLQSQGFLVTQDYIFEETIKIDNTVGKFWQDVFWGQQIEASAIMKVSLGVDLQKLEEGDIDLNDKITIRLPMIENKSIEIVGDIKLTNSQAVLKRVFDNDDGYNQALTEFRNKAGQAALDSEIISEAENSTREEIQRLISLIGLDKEVVVEFK